MIGAVVRASWRPAARWLPPLALAAGCGAPLAPPAGPQLPPLDRDAVLAESAPPAVVVEDLGDTLSLRRDGQVELKAFYPAGAQLPQLAFARDGDRWLVIRAPDLEIMGQRPPQVIASIGPALDVRYSEPPDLDAALAAYGSQVGVEALAEAALWLGPEAARLVPAPEPEHAAVLAALCAGETGGLAARHDPDAGCVSAPDGMTVCVEGAWLTAVEREGISAVLPARAGGALLTVAPGEDPLVAAALSTCDRPDTDALLAEASKGLGQGDLRIAGLLRQHGAAPALLDALGALPEAQARLGRLLLGTPKGPQEAADALSDPAMIEVLQASRCQGGRLSLGDRVLLSGRDPMGRDALIAALDGAPVARRIAVALLSDLTRRPPGPEEALALGRAFVALAEPIDPQAEDLRLLVDCRGAPPEVDASRRAWRQRGNLLRRLAGASEALELSPTRAVIAQARERAPVLTDAALYALGDRAPAERVHSAVAEAVCTAGGELRPADSLTYLFTALSLAEGEPSARARLDAAATRACPALP